MPPAPLMFPATSAPPLRRRARRPLSAGERLEVERQLRCSLDPQRLIAARLGLTLHQVQLIARGLPRRASMRQANGLYLRKGERRVTPTRCDGCRGLVVVLPCRLCRLRRGRGGQP